MLVGDAAAASIALDTDGRASTGADRWADDVGLKARGADRFITVWGTGGRVTDAAGRVRTSGIRVAADTTRNAIEVDIPWSALGPVDSHAARAWVVTGLAAPGGGFQQVKAGATRAWNVGFRGPEAYSVTGSHWSDQSQAAVLASGDVSQYAQNVPLRDMRRKRTRSFRITPGFYDVVFRSRYSYGEGIDLKTKNANLSLQTAGWEDAQFKGRWQTYGLYLPKSWNPRRPNPLTLVGHSLDVNHNEYRTVSPGMLPQLGDERQSILLTPLARGMDTWYLTTGFADVMEAWADVKRRFSTDDERTAISGYSMGGYMTYRMGLLMPDRFTRAASYVGPPAYYQWPYPAPVQSTDFWRVRGDTSRLVDNALNLPFEIVHGNLDELVPVAGVVHQADLFKQAGDEYRFYHHQADDHLSFILADHWEHTRDWLGTGRRVVNPERVRYRRYPSMDLPQYGFRFDRAYWVSGLEVRDRSAGDAATGEIDLRSYGRGLTPTAMKAETRAEAAGAGLSPALVTGQQLETAPATGARNAFGGTLQNVGTVTLDLARMGLESARPLTGELSGDGTTTLRLRGAFTDATRATLDGVSVSVRRVPGGIELDAALAGPLMHTLVVGPG
jgi:predicted esterase